MKRLESSTFKQWLNGLKDDTLRARIVARINRLMEGLAGDVKPIGHGASELRIHFGAGYRVYFYQKGELFIVLLCGGDKSTQQKDIQKAHQLLNEWREQNG